LPRMLPRTVDPSRQDPHLRAASSAQPGAREGSAALALPSTG
jgi:hypothetical protein